MVQASVPVWLTKRNDPLVPATPDDPSAEPNRRAWDRLRRFPPPVVCAVSGQDRPYLRQDGNLFRFGGLARPG